MRNVLRFVAGVLIAISGLSLAGCSSFPSTPPVGSSAPDFTLKNQEGKPISLKDYRGQWVVLYFYKEDYRPPATSSFRSFRRNEQKFQELHAAIFGISRDDVATHKIFADQEQLHFQFLSDEGQKVTEQYGCFERTHIFFHLVIPTAVIIDSNGKIAQVFPDFDPRDPSGELIKALNALQHT